MKRLVFFGIPFLLFLACLPQGGPGGNGTPGAVTAGPGAVPGPTAMDGPDAAPEVGGGSPINLPAAEAENPPMAGPGVGEKCLFDLEGGDSLIRPRSGESPKVFVRSRQAMAGESEMIDLRVEKKIEEDRFVVVEAPSEFILEPDQDPNEEGIQLVALEGFVQFTFVGSAIGKYSVTARGSLGCANHSLVVREMASSAEVPDPSQRVPPVQSEQEEGPSDAASPWIFIREVPSSGSGRMYRLEGGAEGGMPAREVNCSRDDMVPGNCCYECNKPASKFHRRCGCERR